jgi:ASC-1-like (ASCH) protein
MNHKCLYRKHLNDPWFSLVAVGCKTIEGRLHRDDWATMEEGDQIDWYNDDFSLKREFRTLILKKRKYPCLTSYLNTEGLEKTLVTIDNIQDGVKLYHIYYKPTDEKTYGVVAFELKVVSKIKMKEYLS